MKKKTNKKRNQKKKYDLTLLFIEKLNEYHLKLKQARFAKDYFGWRCYFIELFYLICPLLNDKDRELMDEVLDKIIRLKFSNGRYKKCQ